MEFEWNIFPGYNTLQLNEEVNSLLLRLDDTPEILQEGISSCRCLMTSHGDQKTMKKNVNPMINSLLFLRKGLEQDNGHFSVLVQRRSGILSVKIVHKVNGTKWLRR